MENHEVLEWLSTNVSVAHILNGLAIIIPKLIEIKSSSVYLKKKKITLLKWGQLFLIWLDVKCDNRKKKKAILTFKASL